MRSVGDSLAGTGVGLLRVGARSGAYVRPTFPPTWDATKARPTRSQSDWWLVRVLSSTKPLALSTRLGSGVVRLCVGPSGSSRYQSASRAVWWMCSWVLNSSQPASTAAVRRASSSARRGGGWRHGAGGPGRGGRRRRRPPSTSGPGGRSCRWSSACSFRSGYQRQRGRRPRRPRRRAAPQRPQRHPSPAAPWHHQPVKPTLRYLAEALTVDPGHPRWAAQAPSVRVTATGEPPQWRVGAVDRP
jgi:hypothetical protein